MLRLSGKAATWGRSEMWRCFLRTWSGGIVSGRRLYLCWVSPRNTWRKLKKHKVLKFFVVYLQTNFTWIILTVISLTLFAKQSTSSRCLLPLAVSAEGGMVAKIGEAPSDQHRCWSLVHCVSELPFPRWHPPAKVSFFIPNTALPAQPMWHLPRSSNDFCKCRSLSPPNLFSFLPSQILPPTLDHILLIPRWSLLSLLAWYGDTNPLNVNCYPHCPC